jgi:hypothetical protein
MSTNKGNEVLKFVNGVLAGAVLMRVFSPQFLLMLFGPSSPFLTSRIQINYADLSFRINFQPTLHLFQSIINTVADIQINCSHVDWGCHSYPQRYKQLQ